MNKSFVLGALVFAVGVSTGIAIANNEKKKETMRKIDEDVHGIH